MCLLHVLIRIPTTSHQTCALAPTPYRLCGAYVVIMRRYLGSASAKGYLWYSAALPGYLGYVVSRSAIYQYFYASQ